MISNFDNKYAFLSNFYDSPIAIDGITYPTVEHFFQAQKTLDQDERLKIADAATPGRAKRLGRTVSLRKDWEVVKDDVMRIGLRAKFSDEKLKIRLLATNDEELIEGNWWHDNYWGSCSCPKCNSQGKNTLGKLLMELRNELRTM